MKKIVFFDIDGTLLDDDKKLPISAKKAIHTLQENGVYTAIATGRAPFMIQDLLVELNMESYIAYNGQYVVLGDEVIYKNPLNVDGIKRLEIEAMKHNHSLVFMNESTLKANTKDDKRVAGSLRKLITSPIEYHDQFYNETEIYQTLLFAREDEETYLQSFEEFSFIRWHENALDVVPKGGSKAHGINVLIQHLGFEMEHVYAFGDGLNDIEMLKTVGKGIAMGNSHHSVKKCADYITSNVDDDGILNGLKAMGLLADSI